MEERARAKLTLLYGIDNPSDYQVAMYLLLGMVVRIKVSVY